MKVKLDETVLNIDGFSIAQQKPFFDIIHASDIYKKVYPENYELLKNNVNILLYALAVMKIECNMKPELVSLDGNATTGYFHILPRIKEKTVKTYNPKNYKAVAMNAKGNEAEVFIFLHLTYLNLVELRKNGNHLVEKYEDFIVSLFNSFRSSGACRLAILHNQGTSALKHEATEYYPPITYLPMFFFYYNALLMDVQKNIQVTPAVIIPVISLLDLIFGIGVATYVVKLVPEINQNATFDLFRQLANEEIQKQVIDKKNVKWKELREMIEKIGFHLLKKNIITKEEKVEQKEKLEEKKKEEKEEQKKPADEKKKDPASGIFRWLGLGAGAGIGLGLKKIIEDYGLVLIGGAILYQFDKDKGSKKR